MDVNPATPIAKPTHDRRDLARFDPPSALVLGIETSGLAGGIALFRGDHCLGDVQLEEAPRRHAQTLVAQIGTLVGGAGCRVRDLSAVAVSIGPGSFTGLRVGVVCAKTLAYATGCRLAAVDTLRAIAANSPADVARVHVLADALRGDAYVASYQRIDEHVDRPRATGPCGRRGVAGRARTR